MDAERLPTLEAYVYALDTLEPSLPPKHRALLKAHYDAPERTLTATELAAAVGYASYSSVNLQYGTLAKRVCGLLGGIPTFYVSVLVIFKDGGRAKEHLLWVLRPEVASALEWLGWVGESGPH